MPKRRDAPFKVCLTGGGTAGHVTPHFALLPGMERRGWSVFYVGSLGIERELVLGMGLEYHQITSGKLRRYLSVQNILDVFKVAWACIQCLFLFLRQRPDVVFSKGGFVSVPVAIAARAWGVPVISHESDLTPGLATRIIARFAKTVVYTFPETGRYLSGEAQHVGTPVRSELLEGQKARALELCGFSPDDHIQTLLIMGGSQGAQRVNQALEEALPELLQSYRIVHLTGRGKSLAFEHPRYKSFEYVSDELPHLLALADAVVSRAGANSIFELLTLRKPMLLIPLEQGSRGDQVHNAASFEKNGWARVLRETDLNAVRLSREIDALLGESTAMAKRQAAYDGRDVAVRLLNLIEDVGREKK